MFELNLKDHITHGIIKDVAGLAMSRICGFIVYSAKNAKTRFFGTKSEWHIKKGRKF